MIFILGPVSTIDVPPLIRRIAGCFKGRLLQVLRTWWRLCRWTRWSAIRVHYFPLYATSHSLIQIPRVSPRFFTLFRHFFTVAFYSIWVLFAHPRVVPGRVDANGKPLYAVPGIDQYPMLFIMSIQAVSYSRISNLPTFLSIINGGLYG